MISKILIDYTLVKKMLKEPRFIGCVNFSAFDTIYEKYDFLMSQIEDLTNYMVENGTVGHFWICASPKVASNLEVIRPSFNPDTSCDAKIWGYLPQIKHIPIGASEAIVPCGIILKSWQLFTCQAIDSSQVLIGCLINNNDEMHGKMVSNICARATIVTTHLTHTNGNEK